MGEGAGPRAGAAARCSRRAGGGASLQRQVRLAVHVSSLTLNSNPHPEPNPFPGSIRAHGARCDFATVRCWLSRPNLLNAWQPADGQMQCAGRSASSCWTTTTLS